MLILKNVTAVQLHPANVREGVDIAIDKDVIVEVGDALTQRYPQAQWKEDAWANRDAGWSVRITTSTPVYRAGSRPISPPARTLSQR